VSVVDYEHQESAESIAASGGRADDCRLSLRRQTQTAQVKSHDVSAQFLMLNWPVLGSTERIGTYSFRAYICSVMFLSI